LREGARPTGVAAICEDGAVIALIITALLAVLFVVLLWFKSGQPENEGASLGHTSPYPDSVFGLSVMRPPLGSPESLESHDGTDWVGDEFERQRRGHHRSGG